MGLSIHKFGRPELVASAKERARQQWQAKESPVVPLPGGLPGDDAKIRRYQQGMMASLGLRVTLIALAIGTASIAVIRYALTH